MKTSVNEPATGPADTSRGTEDGRDKQTIIVPSKPGPASKLFGALHIPSTSGHASISCLPASVYSVHDLLTDRETVMILPQEPRR